MIPASDQIAETALLEVSRTQRRAFETMSETPADGFGAGHLEYQIRVNFRDLCRLIGKEAARQEIAEIVNAEFSRSRP
jgi:hypothetical protein